MVYNDLYHYGIPGMRWGVRRSKKSLARARKKSNIHDDYKNAHNKKSIKSMSNDELDSRIKRLNKEKQYNDLKKQAGVVNTGHSAVKKYVAIVGTLTAAAAATTGLAIKYGKPIVNKIIEKQKIAWVL